MRRTVLVLAVVGGTALAVEVLLNSSDELFAAADDLTDVSPVWVGVAVVLEMLCYLARGAAQRRLVVSAELPARHRHRTSRTARSEPERSAPSDDPESAARYPRAGTVVLAATVLAGDAAAYCLPFGFAAAGVVSLRVLRRRGVGQVFAGWMFGVATLLYIAVLAVLAVVAAQLAGDSGVTGLQTLATVLLVVMVVGLAALVVVNRLPAGTVGRFFEPLRRRVPALPRPARWNGTGRVSRTTRAARRAVGSWWAEVRRLRLGPAAIALAALGMLVSWLSDIGVLAVSYAALGTPPPWAGLLLAYCAGQVASSVPITPGGIGVVEGSLTLALVAFGGSTETTLAAVLLYRLISHWACVPAGGLAWLALRYTARTHEERLDDPAELTGAGSAAGPASTAEEPSPTAGDVVAGATRLEAP